MTPDDPRPTTLSNRQTRVFLVVFFFLVLGTAVTTGWIILRAQNDPDARARIERINAIRDSTDAVNDSISDAQARERAQQRAQP